MQIRAIQPYNNVAATGNITRKPVSFMGQKKEYDWQVEMDRFVYRIYNDQDKSGKTPDEYRKGLLKSIDSLIPAIVDPDNNTDLQIGGNDKFDFENTVKKFQAFNHREMKKPAGDYNDLDIKNPKDILEEFISVCLPNAEGKIRYKTDQDKLGRFKTEVIAIKWGVISTKLLEIENGAVDKK